MHNEEDTYLALEVLANILEKLAEVSGKIRLNNKLYCMSWNLWHMLVELLQYFSMGVFLNSLYTGP